MLKPFKFLQFVTGSSFGPYVKENHCNKTKVSRFLRVYIAMLLYSSLCHHDYIMKDIFFKIYPHGTTKKIGD